MLYTVSEAADELNASPAYVGRLASELDLGQVEGKTRTLTTTDVHALRRVIDRKRLEN